MPNFLAFRIVDVDGLLVCSVSNVKNIAFGTLDANALTLSYTLYNSFSFSLYCIQLIILLNFFNE